LLYNNTDNDNIHNPLVSKMVYDVVNENKDFFNNLIDYKKDYDFNYFGFKTLEKAYLFRIDNKVVERIQDMILRVSIGLHDDDLKSIQESYEKYIK